MLRPPQTFQAAPASLCSAQPRPDGVLCTSRRYRQQDLQRQTSPQKHTPVHSEQLLSVHHLFLNFIKYISKIYLFRQAFCFTFHWQAEKSRRLSQPFVDIFTSFLEQFKVTAHFIYWMQQRQNLIHIIMQFANVTALMLLHYKSMQLN